MVMHRQTRDTALMARTWRWYYDLQLSWSTVRSMDLGRWICEMSMN